MGLVGRGRAEDEVALREPRKLAKAGFTLKCRVDMVMMSFCVWTGDELTGSKQMRAKMGSRSALLGF